MDGSPLPEPSMRGLMGIAEGTAIDVQKAVEIAVRLFIDRIVANFDIKEAFLFGSHARQACLVVMPGKMRDPTVMWTWQLSSTGSVSD